MRPVTNVIFDLGGVVLRWNPDEILRDFYSDVALQSLAKRELFQHADWLDLDRGTLLEPEAIERFQERSGRPPQETAALLRAARDSLQPIPETVELIDDLAARGVPHIARRFDLAPRDTVFIDDLLANIEGAEHFGFNTILFENAANCRQALSGRFGI